MKEPVLVFFRLYDRLQPLVRRFVETSPYRILSDIPLPAFDDRRDRVQLISEVIPPIDAAVSADYDTRVGPLCAFLRSAVPELPYGCGFSADLLSGLESGFSNGLRKILYHFRTIELLVDKFDVRCIAVSPSHLDRHQAVVACARAHGIPTVHIQHGSYLGPDYQLPECADYIFLADSFGESIFERTRISNAKCRVTGLPYEAEIARGDAGENLRAMHEARTKLKLPAESEVLFYGLTWFDCLNASRAFDVASIISSFEAVLAVAKRREKSGKDVYVVVRRHPTMRAYEDWDAIMSLGDAVGFTNIVPADGELTCALTATDVVLVNAPRTSVIFDAFACAKPVVALNFTPANADGEPVVDKLIDIANSIDDLSEAVEKLLNDHDARVQRGEAGRSFFSKYRHTGGDQAAERIYREISQIAAV